MRNLEGGSFEEREPILMHISSASSPINSVDSQKNLFEKISAQGGPYRNRIERAADRIGSAAKSIVWLLGYVAAYPIPTIAVTWATFFISGFFEFLGRLENHHHSREDYSANAETNPLYIALSVGAYLIAGLMAFAGFWKLLGGVKRPNYSEFKNFMETYVANISTVTNGNEGFRSTIANPKSEKESNDAINWLTGFIDNVAHRAFSYTIGNKTFKPDFVDTWEIVSNILDSIHGYFLFDSIDATAVASISPLSLNGKEEKTDSGVESVTGQLVATEPLFPRSAYVMLSREGQNQEKISSSSSTQNNAILEPTKRLLKDLYKAPLLSNAKMPDSFLQANAEERKSATQLDWRKHQVIKSTTPISQRLIPLYIQSYMAELLLCRDNDASKNPGYFRALIKSMSNLFPHWVKAKELNNEEKLFLTLNSLLANHPVEPDKSNQNPIVREAQEAMKMVLSLRPGLQDAQWCNWRYFYAQDEMVTNAFRRLSPQKQIWMVFRLMSTDQGRLLALSILQDERLSLTELSTFFETYLYEFNSAKSVVKTKTEEIYQYLYRVSPNADEMDRFLKKMSYVVREHLLWLTDNSTGRITQLFEADPSCAAKILLNFTVDLPAEEWVKDFCILATGKQEAEKPFKVSYKDDQLDVHEYYVVPPKEDGSYHFSLLGEGVTRRDVVTTLKAHVKHKKLNLCSYLSEEICDLLTNPTKRHSVPKALAFGVLIAQLGECYKKYAAYLPPDQQKEHLDLEGVLEYYEGNSPLQSLPQAFDRRHAILKVKNLIFSFKNATKGKTELQYLLQNTVSYKEKLEQYCQDENTVTTYLEEAVGFNQPLCVRTAVMYAAVNGHPVEVYSLDTHGKAQLVLYKAPEDTDDISKEVRRFLMRKGYDNFALLEAKEQYEQKLTQRNASAGRFEELNNFLHPMIKRAQQLFWSLSCHQNRICTYMEQGNKAVPLTGYVGSSEKLFSCELEESIDAIRKSVLASECLDVLLPFLKSKQLNDNKTAFLILAVLFSDPDNGIKHQRVFEKLVVKHRKKIAGPEQIAAFANWLNNERDQSGDKMPQRFDKAPIRARYTMAILMWIDGFSNQFAESAIEMLDVLYPDEETITAFNDLYFACSAREIGEQSERKVLENFFEGVCYKKILSIEDEVSEDRGLEFKFMSKQNRSLLPTILDGFAEQNKNSWGDLLSIMLSKTALYRVDYMKSIINQFCQVIEKGGLCDQGKTYDVETRKDLALVLLNALNYHITSAFKKGFEDRFEPPLLQAMHTVIVSLRGLNLDFLSANNRLKALGAELATLEKFYIQVAGYLLNPTEDVSDDSTTSDYSNNDIEMGSTTCSKPDYAEVNSLLSTVLAQKASYDALSTQDYETMGDLFSYICRDSCFNAVKPKIAFAFFSRCENIIDLRSYGASFLDLCESVSPNASSSSPSSTTALSYSSASSEGSDNLSITAAADGLKNLIKEIKKDSVLTEMKSEQVNTVVLRMQALFLYQRIYKELSQYGLSDCVQRFFTYCCRRREGYEELPDTINSVQGLQQVLKTVLSEEHEDLASYFEKPSPLSEAFDQLEMSFVCDAILKFIKKNEFNETTPLATEMNPS